MSEQERDRDGGRVGAQPPGTTEHPTNGGGDDRPQQQQPETPAGGGGATTQGTTEHPSVDPPDEGEGGDEGDGSSNP
jgi:hypothetical protein